MISRPNKGESAHTAQHPTGFTLVEVLLVLALVVVLTALAAPAIRQAWDHHALRQSGDLLRAACAHARAAAMRTGHIQLLRVELGGSRYYQQAWSTDDDLLELSEQATLEQAVSPSAMAPLRMKQLPEFISFHSADGAFDSRATSVEETLAQVERGGTDWSRPILFYPDGSCSAARIAIVNRRNVALPLRTSSLTGLCQVGEATTVDMLASTEP